ncbi:MAG: hypothetical protein IKD44_09795 [Lentisphaeria bacterium]|nr:hypothetical protein [Lentisphaeria bacterium]
MLNAYDFDITELPLVKVPIWSLKTEEPFAKLFPIQDQTLTDIIDDMSLNNLAPDIVEAIVNGAEPDGLSIAQIMKNIPEEWNEQRKSFGFPER